MAVSESSIHQHLKLLRQTSGQMEIFQRFMETSGQGLGMADLDGWIFYVNAGLCQMRGLEHPDESYDQELFTFYPPEEAKRIKEEILPLVRQEGQWVGELKILNVQGSAIPVIQNIFLLRDEKDRPLCFATVITDITERIFQEEELRIYRDQLAKLVAERTAQLEKANALLRTEIVERKRAEAEYARLTSIMENTSDLVALVTPDGWLTYMNAAGRRMLGWGEDEDISARHLRDAHAASDLRVIMEEGIPAAVKSGLWRGESKVLRQNGQVISVSQVIMAHRGAGGEITYISTIMRDITERKQAEEALRASEIRYRRLFEAAQDGILILNEENGQIEDVNPFLKNLSRL